MENLTKEQEKRISDCLRKAEAEIFNITGTKAVVHNWQFVDSANLLSVLTPNEITNIVADEWGFNYKDLQKAFKGQKTVYARWQCWYFINLSSPKLSLKTRGYMFNRDHTTVLHAITYHVEAVKHNREYIQIYNNCHRKLIDISVAKLAAIEAAKNKTTQTSTN